MEENKGLLLFTNYQKHFEALGKEKGYDLLIHLFNYADTGEVEVIEDPFVSMAYDFITDNMVIGTKRRMASVVNGSKGGRPPTNAPKKETKPKAPKKEEPLKRKYGEFDNVALTDEQKDKLLIKYITVDKRDQGIEILSAYKESNAKTYKSDYAVLIGWVFEKVSTMPVNKANEEKIVMENIKEFTKGVEWQM